MSFFTRLRGDRLPRESRSVCEKGAAKRELATAKRGPELVARAAQPGRLGEDHGPEDREAEARGELSKEFAELPLRHFQVGSPNLLPFSAR